MAALRIGDRVRLKYYHNGLNAGTTGTVVITYRDGLVGVKLDAPLGARNYFTASNYRFDLIQETTMNLDGIEFDEPSTTTIAQAAVFLGKKVLVKHKGNGTALRLGKIVRVTADLRDVSVVVAPLFEGETKELTFTSYTFEEIE